MKYERHTFHRHHDCSTVEPADGWEVSINDGPWNDQPVTVWPGQKIHLRPKSRASLFEDPIPTWAFIALVGIPALIVSTAVWMMP